MTRWAFDTIRTRVVGGLAVLVAGMGLTALLGVTALRTMRESVLEELLTLRAASEVTNGLVVTVFDEMRTAEQYLSAPSTEARTQFTAAADAAFNHLRRLESLESLTVDDRLTVNRLKQLHAGIQVEYAMAHALLDLGRTAEAVGRSSGVRTPATELMQLVRGLATRQVARAGTVADRFAALAGSREVLLWFLVGIVLVGGTGVAVVTLRAVEQPLGRLVIAADRLGGGDLRPVARGRMPAELRVLADAMGGMAERLRAIVEEVVTEADRIAGSAGDLSAVSEQLAASSSEISTAMVDISSGAESQRTDLRDVGAALDRLRTATDQMTEAAGRVTSLGGNIRTVADRYRGDIATAGEALREVRGAVEAASGRVSALSDRSAAIDDFVDLIKRISSQTNLLALNAAIEAARAGEHGRGFAVVAQEVRQLADESARAAEDVALATSAIRAQVTEASASMAAGQSRVRSVAATADAAVRGLAEIVTAVEQVEQAAARLARTATDARDITARIGQTVEHVSSRALSHASGAEEVTAAAQQQGASTEETAAAAGHLLQAAEKLRGLVRGFRT